MNENDTVKITLESIGLILSNAPSKSLAKQEKMENAEPQSLQRSFVFVSDVGSDDSGSIVVLGKNSLDEIQRQSLASYEQIRMKSMAIDYKSIISSLTPPEIEQKLIDVLQENLRLKDTLEESNLSLKKHLNILISRQAELNRVHEAHKQKFAETKNLVQILRAENHEYRTRMEREKVESTEGSTQTEIREEGKHISMESSGEGSEQDNKKFIEACQQRDREIAHKQIIIASLEQQLESLYKNLFQSIRPQSSSSNEQQGEEICSREFLKSFEHYNEKLCALRNCYVAQASRYTSIQECLRRCTEILAEKENANEAESQQSLLSMKSKELQEIRSKLIDEELKTICERQEMIKSQKEFQQIFTDYNATLLEVESLRKDRECMTSLQKCATLHDERLDEAKANLRRSEKMLEAERHSLEQARIDLTRQKDHIEQEKIRLQTQEAKLIEANASLHEEAAAVRESNGVLQEQLKVYETDWAEQLKLFDAMRAEKNELLRRIQTLEEEKNRWISTMRYLEGNPID